MDTNTWAPLPEKGTYIEQLYEESLTQNVWETCYMPYIQKVMRKPDHQFYVDPRSQIRHFLESSGIESAKIHDLIIDYDRESSEYVPKNMPDGVTRYPPPQVINRSTSISYKPQVPFMNEKMYLRAFDDYSEFAGDNAGRYHAGCITNEERLQNLDAFEKRCESLPKWSGFNAIQWRA